MNRLKFWYCLLNLIPVMLGLAGCGSTPPPLIVTLAPITLVSTATPLPPATPSPTIPAIVTVVQPTPIPLPGPATPEAVAIEAAPAPVPEILLPTSVPDPQHGLIWTFYPLPGGYICNQEIKDNCYMAWPDTRDLVIDREQRVWTAHSDGIRVLTETGVSPTWLRYTQANGLPSDDVQALAVDQAGRIWAAAGGSLVVFNGGVWTPIEIPPGRSVSALTADPAGQVWANTGQEVVKFDSNLQIQEVIPFEEAPESLFSRLAVDQAGRVWVSSFGRRLSLFDGANWMTYPAPANVSWDYVKRLRVDPGGNLWLTYGQCFFDALSCTSMGLSHFDGQSWSHYLQSTGLLNTSMDMVLDVALDPEGNAWVVTADGIRKFDGHAWTTYGQNLHPGGHLIAIDGAGNKWIGSYKQIFKISP